MKDTNSKIIAALFGAVAFAGLAVVWRSTSQPSKERTEKKRRH